MRKKRPEVLFYGHLIIFVYKQQKQSQTDNKIN